MNLQESINRLATRFQIDLDSEIDVTSDSEMTTAIIEAAKQYSRDTYSLWTWKADLTISNGIAEYNLLDSSICSLPVFHPYGVYINGGWLCELTTDEFSCQNPDYHNQTSNAQPSVWTLYEDSKIRLAVPPNSTAVASTYKYCKGFYEHPIYDPVLDLSTELLTPSQSHYLIIDKAAINISISYVAGSEGYARRAAMETRYLAETAKIKAANMARYKKEKRGGNAGNVRRIFTLGA